MVFFSIDLNSPIDDSDEAFVAQLGQLAADGDPGAPHDLPQLAVGIVDAQIVPAGVGHILPFHRSAEKPFQAVFAGIEGQVADFIAEDQHFLGKALEKSIPEQFVFPHQTVGFVDRDQINGGFGFSLRVKTGLFVEKQRRLPEKPTGGERVKDFEAAFIIVHVMFGAATFNIVYSLNCFPWQLKDMLGRVNQMLRNGGQQPVQLLTVQ